MTPEHAELCERLKAPVWDPEMGYQHIEIAEEAAAAITALSEENERLRKALDMAGRAIEHVKANLIQNTLVTRTMLDRSFDLRNLDNALAARAALGEKP